MPVLYGVFLYMGVASLSGIQVRQVGPTQLVLPGWPRPRHNVTLLLPAQFWDRIKLYLMPSKHQPDFSYLRHVPLRRVHLFTLVQITCLAVLWILKSTFMAIIFPVMVCGETSPLIIYQYPPP